jgi:hypothetical protein
VRSPQPPLEYLVTCSQSCLEGFELARRDQISKLRAELRDIHEEWIEAEVAARLSRLLLDGRRAEIGAGESPQFALDSIASARQTSATPSLAAPLSGLAGKSPVSLFRPEQCVPGDHRSMPSPEAAALRPRHPESAALQLRRSSDVGSRASARQVPPKRMRAQLDAANNSRQKISHQSTSHGGHVDPPMICSIFLRWASFPSSGQRAPRLRLSRYESGRRNNFRCFSRMKMIVRLMARIQPRPASQTGARFALLSQAPLPPFLKI